MDLGKESLKLHEKSKGKVSIKSKVAVNNKQDLSLVYTPGVAEVCRAIVANPKNVYK